MKFLRAVFLMIGFLTFQFVSAQFCVSGDRFTQAEVFTSSQISEVKNVEFAQVVTCKNHNQVLRFDLYAPNKNIDQMVKRPLIVMAHGGAFIQGERTNLTNDCKSFARRGFVAVTMSYRLGWNVSGYTCNTTENTQGHAAYRAMQDMHAAIRYLVEHADEYGIDTNWIFIGGSSAGAVAALNLAFGSQEEFDVRVPAFRASLGELNNSGNSLINDFTVKGIFNNWGALMDIKLIQPEDNIPVIAFHGDADPTVPVDEGTNRGTVLYGSRVVHQRLDSLGICTDLTVKPGGEHGVYVSNRAQSDFRISRASCFFKQLFCSSCTSFYSTDSVGPVCNGITTGIESKNVGTQINIFPNPANELLNISGISSSDWDVELLNVQGQQLIYRKNIQQLDVRSLNAGVYFLRIRQGTDWTVHRFVKE